MELTPLRIRGKRKRKGNNSSASSAITSVASSRSSTPAIVQTSINGTRNSVSSKVAKKRKKEPSKPAMPSIQGIPQEILEMIFLYSMNPALPRSSPDIGTKLSSTSTCLRFYMRAFCDTKPTLKSRPTDPASPELQSDILKSKFFTWSFFKKYAQRAYETSKRRRGKGWEKTGVPFPDPSKLDGLWPISMIKINYLGFAESFYIPEKLLHGPWTDDKASLLYLLTFWHGEIDWEGSTAGETAKEGLLDAIREGNHRAAAALATLLGVAQALSTEALRLAVLENGCDLEIVKHLLFNAQILSRGGAMDFHDRMLWNWAQRAEESDNSKGSRLREMLKKAEQFALNFYERGQTNFDGTVSFPYSGPYFDARSALGESTLRQELLMKLYRNYGRRITNGRRSLSENQRVVHEEEHPHEDLQVQHTEETMAESDF